MFDFTNYRDLDAFYMIDYVQRRANGMEVIEKRYEAAIEDVITINEIKNWTSRLQNDEVDGIIRDIDLYYKLEMNMEFE